MIEISRMIMTAYLPEPVKVIRMVYLRPCEEGECVADGAMKRD